MEIKRTELNKQWYNVTYRVLRLVIGDEGIHTELPAIECDTLGDAGAVALECIQKVDCDVAEVQTVTKTEYSHSRYERVSG